MRPVLDAAQMRAWDEHQISNGVSGVVLMENAGRGAAHLIGLKVRPRVEGAAPRVGSPVAGTCVRCADEKSLGGARVLILCGPGNNGGDGFVVARHLHSRGASVRVLGWGSKEQLTGDAALACQAMEAVGVPWQPLPHKQEWAAAFAEATVVVDALLGTGAARPLEGTLKELVECLNGSQAYCVALDVPSGLDASTGALLGVAVEAAHTVTFGHLKKGLLSSNGHRCAGTVTLSHIGVPSTLGDIEPAAWLLEQSDVRASISPRSAVAHKGTAGKVVVVAGSPGTLGAARLSARSALRAGAGVVTVATHPEAVEHLDREVLEIMTHALGPDEASRRLLAGADVLVVGPGLGRDNAARELMRLCLAARRTTVVDADALRMIAADPGSGSLDHCVLTPHPGEAAALLACPIEQVESDRFAAAQCLADRTGAVVLLKGSRPIVASAGRAPVVSAFGSPALATAGSGDVLCGILAAQLVGVSDRQELFDGTTCALGLQGIAAERWSERNGDRGLLASEVGDLVPLVMKELLASR